MLREWVEEVWWLMCWEGRVGWQEERVVVRVEGERGVPKCGCALVHVPFLHFGGEWDGEGGEEGSRRDLWRRDGRV